MHVHTHTQTHADQLLCRGTHTHYFTFNPVAELKPRTHLLLLTNARTQGLRLKDRLSGIITPARRRLAFGLKDSIVFFFGRGMEGGGRAKWNPVPQGHSKGRAVLK